MHIYPCLEYDKQTDCQANMPQTCLGILSRDKAEAANKPIQNKTDTSKGVPTYDIQYNAIYGKLETCPTGSGLGYLWRV